jgi:hypothetical protein
MSPAPGTHIFSENTMSRLTRQGARNLTATLDRIASTVQSNPAVLGIDDKIAKDFAYRCDLISDAVERTAVTNFPRQADENSSVPSGGGDYQVAKPGIEKEIGAEVKGPIYEEDPATSADLTDHFTQKDFHQLTDLAEKLKTAASALLPVSDHGFDLTK